MVEAKFTLFQMQQKGMPGHALELLEAGFIFTLRDAGVEFVCCDMHDANTLTVGLFAVLAQHERETISKRTKDALTAKKARGATLGTPANLTAQARQRGLVLRQQNAREHQANKQASRVATLLLLQGHNLTQIARELNEAGYRTRRGKAFHLATVRRLLVRADSKPMPPVAHLLADAEV